MNKRLLQRLYFLTDLPQDLKERASKSAPLYSSGGVVITLADVDKAIQDARDRGLNLLADLLEAVPGD